MRVRPGIAVSALFHIALAIYLSYELSIPPTPPPPPEEEELNMAPPPPPAATPPPKTSQALFIPSPSPAVAGVPTSVAALPIPAEPELKHTQVVQQKEPEKPKADVIMQPKPLKIVPPDYPSRAEEHQLEGVVEIDFTINPDGSVGAPKVISETPDGYGFAAAAIKSFEKWKFKPKEVNGQGVPAAAHYRFRFQIR